MLLNDSMYGILFRDINMRRTFVDQYFSRRIIGRARHHHQHGRRQLPDHGRRGRGGAHRARQPVHQRGLRAPRRAARRADRPGPRLRDRPLARGQLRARARPGAAGAAGVPATIRSSGCRPPNTRPATSSRATCTTRCSAWWASMTGQSIQLLGMFSEAIHNPLMMDRYLSLKATRYVFNAAKHLGEELELSARTVASQRARAAGARRGLRSARDRAQRDAVERHRARRLCRRASASPTAARGLSGVVRASADYLNPMLERLEASMKERPTQDLARLRRPRRRRHGAAQLHARAVAVAAAKEAARRFARGARPRRGARHLHGAVRTRAQLLRGVRPQPPLGGRCRASR